MPAKSQHGPRKDMFAGGSSSKSEDVDVVGDSDYSVSTQSSQPNSSPAYAETDYTNVEGVAEHRFAKMPLWRGRS